MERSLLTTLLVVLVATVTLSLIATGVTQAQAPGPVTSPPQLPAWDEAEAQSIDRSIMCPVCPAETIDQAQVPIARQMRQLVREKLAAGESRGEILKYFAERYGQDIVAFPPKSGLNLVAWVFPVVSVALLLAGGGLVLRAMASRRGVPDPAPVPSRRNAGTLSGKGGRGVGPVADLPAARCGFRRRSPGSRHRRVGIAWPIWEQSPSG